MPDDQMKLHLSHSCRSLLEVITVFWRAQNGVFCTQSPSEPHAHSVAHTRRSVRRRFEGQTRSVAVAGRGRRALAALAEYVFSEEIRSADAVHEIPADTPAEAV